MLLTVPIQKKRVILHIAILWCIVPIVVYAVTTFNRRQGFYPPEADTIIIPIINATVLWLIGLPYFGLVLWAALKNFKGGSSIFTFHVSRQELFAVFLTLPGIAICLLAILYWSSPHHWLIAMIYLLVIHWLLLIRASISDKGAT